MVQHWQDIPAPILGRLREGTVIPAHPLALTADHLLDTRRQRALTRYYIDAGVGGLAVGVHTTQFEIREAGLFEPVLSLAGETMADWGGPDLLRIAGLCGGTAQAIAEARAAVSLGYHAGLMSLAALKGANQDELIAHCRAIADEIPLVGFYLQPAVGGILLDADFWRQFAEIENVIAIKIAPFNRYHTLDVIHGVVEAEAEERITLYTGNDDHILLDLVIPFTVMRRGEPITVRIKGGLLGHWSVWTKRAVELFANCKAQAAQNHVDATFLGLDSQITDCNKAFFDVVNNFRGCIAGCHEVLRRQGLLEGLWCLDPEERLGPGQMQEIDRVYQAYPELNDDAFVKAGLQKWLN